MIQLSYRQRTFDFKAILLCNSFYISPFRVICAKRQGKSSLSLHCLCPNSFRENFPHPHLPLYGSFELFPNWRSCTRFSIVGNSAEGWTEPTLWGSLFFCFSQVPSGHMPLSKAESASLMEWRQAGQLWRRLRKTKLMAADSFKKQTKTKRLN